MTHKPSDNGKNDISVSSPEFMRLQYAVKPKKEMSYEDKDLLWKNERFHQIRKNKEAHFSSICAPILSGKYKDVRTDEQKVRFCQNMFEFGEPYPDENVTEVVKRRNNEKYIHPKLHTPSLWRYIGIAHLIICILIDIADFGFGVLFWLPVIRANVWVDFTLNLLVFLFTFFLYGPKWFTILSSVEFLVNLFYLSGEMAYIQLITLFPFHTLAAIVGLITVASFKSNIRRDIENFTYSQILGGKIHPDEKINLVPLYKTLYPENMKSEYHFKR